MTISVNNDWQPILEKAAQKNSYLSLREFLKKEYETATVYPEKENIWQAFIWTPYHDVKVVLLGQDPYHGENQAHGLSFSVDPSVSIPPSLRNVYKELESDLGIPKASHGYLKKWAKEGVLLFEKHCFDCKKGERAFASKKGVERFNR